MAAARDRATAAALEAFQRGALGEEDYLELLDLIVGASDPGLLEALARHLAGWPTWDPRRELRAAGLWAVAGQGTGGAEGLGSSRRSGRTIPDPVDLARARQARRLDRGPADARLVSLVVVLLLVLALLILGVVLALAVQHGHPGPGPGALGWPRQVVRQSRAVL